METTGFAIAIMAAGKGTRLKSKRPKVLHEIGGRALLLHVIAAAKTVVAPEHIYCIVGHEAERVQAAVAPTGVKFVMQEEQRGTGHAMQMVKAYFALTGETVPKHLLVLSGDVPLIRPETMLRICDLHLAEKRGDDDSHCRACGPHRLRPRASRCSGCARGRRDRGAEGAYGRSSSARRRSTPASTASRRRRCSTSSTCSRPNNAHGEFYLTDIAAMLVGDGKRVVALKAESVDEVLGANTIAEMMQLDAAMRMATARRLMAEGVTIFRPETCVIDAQVAVGADTVIEPYVQLLGATQIGSDCRIRSYSVMQNSVLGDGVTVRNGCVLDGAQVATARCLAPTRTCARRARSARARTSATSVETKKITMGKGSKANHLTYLGDAVIGAGVNIGAGVDHLQLRRRKQAPHDHRRRRLRRLRLDAGRAGHAWRGRVRCGGQLHHARCSRRSAGAGPQPASR